MWKYTHTQTHTHSYTQSSTHIRIRVVSGICSSIRGGGGGGDARKRFITVNWLVYTLCIDLYSCFVLHIHKYIGEYSVYNVHMGIYRCVNETSMKCVNDAHTTGHTWINNTSKNYNWFDYKLDIIHIHICIQKYYMCAYKIHRIPTDVLLLLTRRGGHNSGSVYGFCTIYYHNI